MFVSLVGCAVELVGYGHGAAKASLVAVNGQSANSYQAVYGITIASLSMTDTSCRINSSAIFQIHHAAPAQQFAQYLRSLANGTIVVAATSDAVTSGLSHYSSTLKELFDIDLSAITVYKSFVFIAKVRDHSFTRFKMGETQRGCVHLVEKIRPFPQGKYKLLNGTTRNIWQR